MNNSNLTLGMLLAIGRDAGPFQPDNREFRILETHIVTVHDNGTTRLRRCYNVTDGQSNLRVWFWVRTADEVIPDAEIFECWCLEWNQPLPRVA